MSSDGGCGFWSGSRGRRSRAEVCSLFSEGAPQKACTDATMRNFSFVSSDGHDCILRSLRPLSVVRLSFESLLGTHFLDAERPWGRVARMETPASRLWGCGFWERLHPVSFTERASGMLRATVRPLRRPCFYSLHVSTFLEDVELLLHVCAPECEDSDTSMLIVNTTLPLSVPDDSQACV